MTLMINFIVNLPQSLLVKVFLPRDAYTMCTHSGGCYDLISVCRSKAGVLSKMLNGSSQL